MSSTKRCTKCGEVKPLDAFNRHQGKPLGRRSRCRACQREYDRAWRETNRDRKRETDRAWYETNRDRKREYYAANRDRYHERDRRRRARKRAATVEEFTLADVYAWWDELGVHTCFWCGLPFAEGDSIHVDHVWPLSRGGHHAVRNLVPTCERCNLSKHSSLPHEFEERAYEEWLASTPE